MPLQGDDMGESAQNIPIFCNFLEVGGIAAFNTPMTPDLTIRGFEIYERLLEPAAQQALVKDLRDVIAPVPFVQPVTPSGRKMSVRMTSLGRVGWITDRQGYRYEGVHPNGTPWPAILQSIMAIWDRVSGVNRPPDCCLVNYYAEATKMGMHQDKDEGAFDWPVVSVSLGDEALFRMGGQTRGGKTDSLWLRSGDVVVMGGDARLAYHGIDRIKFASSPLLPKGGRINLTLRVVSDRQTS